jgi:hypothetical protein
MYNRLTGLAAAPLEYTSPRRKMTSPAPQSTAPNTVGITGFFTDPGFDFVTRSMIGYAAQGVMDIGQVFATIARVRDGDADSWYAAWRATAEKLHGLAKASLTAGHTATAHRQFLSASEGYAQAIAFADGQTDHTTFAPAFALQTECWEAFVDTSAGRVERIAVPYEQTSLPGFLFRPDSSGAKRPTIVMTNGKRGLEIRTLGMGRFLDVIAWMECFHIRWPGPAKYAVRSGPSVPFRLGGSVDACGR